MTNADLIRAHYAASDSGDLAGMLAPLAPNVEWTESAGFPYAGTYVGPEAVAENVFGRIQADFEGFTVVIDEILESDETVIAIGTYSGTHRTTRKSFTARVVHIWRVRDNAVVAFEQVPDSAVVVQAIQPDTPND